jgi:hypothetical protein
MMYEANRRRPGPADRVRREEGRAMKCCWLWLIAFCLLLCAAASAAETEEAPQLLLPDFATVDGDTLRTNLWVAEALLGVAVDELLAALPPPPAVVLLVPATTEAAANLLTSVATARLGRSGYQVHLDRVPAGTDQPVVELRYRVNSLELKYPETGRRLGIWKSWYARQMSVTAELTVVERQDGQILASRRVAHTYRDRVPEDYLTAIESPAYPFTRAAPQASGWTRRLEEIVVLGALAGLVVIYFANTE